MIKNDFDSKKLNNLFMELLSANELPWKTILVSNMTNIPTFQLLDTSENQVDIKKNIYQFFREQVEEFDIEKIPFFVLKLETFIKSQNRDEYKPRFLETMNDYMQIFRTKNGGSDKEAIKQLLEYVVDETLTTFSGLLRDSLKYAAKEFAKELFEFSLEEYSEKISFRLKSKKTNEGLTNTSIDKNDKRIIRVIFLNDIDVQNASEEDWKKITDNSYFRSMSEVKKRVSELKNVIVLLNEITNELGIHPIKKEKEDSKMNSNKKLNEVSMNVAIEDRPDYSNHPLFQVIPYVETENLSKSVVVNGLVQIANPEYQAKIIELRLKDKLTVSQIEIKVFGRVYGNGTLAWKTLQYFGINTGTTWNVSDEMIESFIESISKKNESTSSSEAKTMKTDAWNSFENSNKDDELLKWINPVDNEKVSISYKQHLEIFTKNGMKESLFYYLHEGLGGEKNEMKVLGRTNHGIILSASLAFYGIDTSGSNRGKLRGFRPEKVRSLVSNYIDNLF